MYIKPVIVAKVHLEKTDFKYDNAQMNNIKKYWIFYILSVVCKQRYLECQIKCVLLIDIIQTTQ